MCQAIFQKLVNLSQDTIYDVRREMKEESPDRHFLNFCLI